MSDKKGKVYKPELHLAVNPLPVSS